MDKKIEKDLKEVLGNLFKALEVKAEFEVSEIEEGFNVVLSTDDSGIVIGHHGDTLEALQIIATLCVSKKLGEFKRVSIEVGDYKRNREDYLRNLALETKERVLSEGREISLPDLKSWERRVVHLILQGDGEVVSESIGEGKDRILTIKPK